MNEPKDGAVASDQSVIMPWSKRAEELGQSEGPYSDYAAFCEWLEAWNERQQPSIQFDTDAVDKTSLYIAFFAACSETSDSPKCEECGDTLTGHEDDSGTHCRWCVTCVAEGKDDMSVDRPINRPSELGM